MTVKRPFLIVCAFFVAGMYLIATLGATIAFAVVFCSALAFLIKALKVKKLYENIILFSSLVFLCLGVFLYANASDISSKKMYPFVSKTVTVSGEALDDSNLGENYIRFTLKAKKVLDDNGTTLVNDKISVVCFSNDGEDITKVLKVIKGDIISVKCNISLPDNAMNTAGFDYSKYLNSKDIFFCGTANIKDFSVTGHITRPVRDFIENIRKTCVAHFDNAFPTEEAGMLKAFVLGDKLNLDETVSDAFSASGLAHVLAVSGMHVAVFISCVMAFLKLFIVSRRKQIIISSFAVVFFVLFTGASTSALRAGIMCLGTIIPPLISKKLDPLTSLTFSAAVLSLYNPLAILEASFLLSFGATFGILVFSQSFSQALSFVYSKIKKETKLYTFIKSVCELFSVGISAQIAILPLLIYFFKEFSTVSILATVLINPILAPMLVGGLLFCGVSFIGAVPALPVAGFTFVFSKISIIFAKFFASFSFSKITFGGITPLFILLYILIIVSIYFSFVRFSRKGRLISGVSSLVLILIIISGNNLTPDTAQISFINVGQGDCALIKSGKNCDILIDAGGKEGDYSTGEEIVAPYLVQNRVSDIEYAVASHGHEDHVNGIIGLMDIVEIEKVIVPLGFGLTDAGNELIEKANEKNIEIIYMKRGDVLKISDEMKITAIMPDIKTATYLTENEENDRSLMLKFEYGDVSFLFTGDMTSTGENYAVSYYSSFLEADVLKIAHHGSKNSSSKEFLEKVNPSYAYIPVGKNSYGHPHDETIDRLDDAGIVFYRADIHKDVTFYFNSSEIKGIYYNSSISGGF